MFKMNTSPEDDKLNFVINDLLNDLRGGVGSSKEDHADFTAATDNVIKLIKLQKESNPSWRPSPDAILGATATIVTAVLVLHYEKIGSIGSKAFGFIGRGFK